MLGEQESSEGGFRRFFAVKTADADVVGAAANALALAWQGCVEMTIFDVGESPDAWRAFDGVRVEALFTYASGSEYLLPMFVGR